MFEAMTLALTVGMGNCNQCISSNKSMLTLGVNRPLEFALGDQTLFRLETSMCPWLSLSQCVHQQRMSLLALISSGLRIPREEGAPIYYLTNFFSPKTASQFWSRWVVRSFAMRAVMIISQPNMFPAYNHSKKIKTIASHMKFINNHLQIQNWQIKFWEYKINGLQRTLKSGSRILLTAHLANLSGENERKWTKGGEHLWHPRAFNNTGKFSAGNPKTRGADTCLQKKQGFLGKQWSSRSWKTKEKR